jgi:histone deacetylase complex regulatory component SIN3
VNKILNFFKQKDDIYYRFLDIELKLEHQQRQIDELREMLLTLSRDINSIQIELNYISNSKYGKGI